MPVLGANYSSNDKNVNTILATMQSTFSQFQKIYCEKIAQQAVNMASVIIERSKNDPNRIESSEALNQLNSMLDALFQNENIRMSKLTDEEKVRVNTQLKALFAVIINQTSVLDKKTKKVYVDVNLFEKNLMGVLYAFCPNAKNLKPQIMNEQQMQATSNFGQTNSNYFIIFLLLVIVYFVFFNKRKVSFGKRR